MRFFAVKSKKTGKFCGYVSAPELEAPAIFSDELELHSIESMILLRTKAKLKFSFNEHFNHTKIYSDSEQITFGGDMMVIVKNHRPEQIDLVLLELRELGHLE